MSACTASAHTSSFRWHGIAHSGCNQRTRNIPAHPVLANRTCPACTSCCRRQAMLKNLTRQVTNQFVQLPAVLSKSIALSWQTCCLTTPQILHVIHHSYRANMDTQGIATIDRVSKRPGHALKIFSRCACLRNLVLTCQTTGYPTGRFCAQIKASIPGRKTLCKRRASDLLAKDGIIQTNRGCQTRSCMDT
jgi:hypothetical protein